MAYSANQSIVFENVSKFYGDVLGVNRISLAIGPGVTSLVGPNGSGKTTLMNLMTGLIWPTKGAVRVLGLTAHDPERFFRPPYVGPRGWIGVRIDDDVDWTEVAELCQDAYRTVAPTRLIRILDSRPT